MELWERVRKIADFMGLRCWGIVVDERPNDVDAEDDTVYARAVCADQALEVVFRFWKPFYVAEPHEQRRIIIHECAHCIFKPLDESVDAFADAFEKLVEKVDTSQEVAAESLSELYDVHYSDLRERVLDQFARIINDAAELGLH